MKRLTLLLIVLILLAGCVTVQASTPATPTPAPTPAPSIFKAGRNLQCQLNNGFFFRFTIKAVSGNWLYVGYVQAPEALGISRTTMWIRTDALSLCWTEVYR